MQKQVITAIEKVLEVFPNLRICQVIGNCFPAGDLYYKTDKELLKAIIDSYPQVFN